MVVSNGPTESRIQVQSLRLAGLGGDVKIGKIVNPGLGHPRRHLYLRAPTLLGS